MCKHLTKTSHNIHWEGSKVIHQKSVDGLRKIKEIIHIQCQRRSLNRDRGYIPPLAPAITWLKFQTLVTWLHLSHLHLLMNTLRCSWKLRINPVSGYVCLTTGDLALLRALLLVELKLFLEERACGLSHLKASMKIYQRISDHTVVWQWWKSFWWIFTM